MFFSQNQNKTPKPVEILPPPTSSCTYPGIVNQSNNSNLIKEEADDDVILLAKSKEYMELYNIVTANDQDIFPKERCAKCNECKVCKQTRDSKDVFKQSEQEFIERCVIFNEEEKRFYAHLPWKVDPSLLQGNYSIARKSHEQEKRKAHKTKGHPELARDSFHQMLSRGTVAAVSRLPLGNGVDDGLQDHLNSIKEPHFTVNTLVYKLQSASTQCRITMDGSRITTRNKLTINKSLMTGCPDYSLVRSLNFWRLNNYGASTDISKFFNTICLFPKDRQYLSMLFSEEFTLEDLPQWFVLLVHSFGYNSSSAISKVAVKKICEAKNIHELHDVVKTLKLGYVDDLNPSTNTMDEMLDLKRTEVCKQE